MHLNQWSALLCMLLACGVCGDMYLQNPRGSNDRLNENGQDRNNDNRLFDSQNNARGGYCITATGPQMKFVTGSILPIQWTAQHGCGGPHVTCTEIIQYMCTDTVNGNQNDILRDGLTTNTIPNDATYNTKTGADFQFGMQEPREYYQDCAARARNAGLFLADQNINNNPARATNTRQNPNGNNNNNRFGFECPEERDYYPYWHPSPWKDIAVLTDTMEHCAFYQQESQNVKAKNYCVFTPTATNVAVPNNEAACDTAGGKWQSQPAWGIAPPDCGLAVFSRDNHLGNAGPGTETANYTWVLPSAAQESCITTGSCQCALRIRYNITTNESSGLTDQFIDARNNSILEDYPTVDVEGGQVELAINTAQFGRTFQDRSHMFRIVARPDGIDVAAKIFNLNVRGKRGNIVQTFPATEYDYTPNRLTVEQGDYIHFQWTGCDTNPNNNEGQGTAGTDRSNIMQIENLDSNLPLTPGQDGSTPLFDTAALRIRMALIDQPNCATNAQNCALLNAATSPYFDGGLIQMNKTGTFTYMGTRNNNFSNRTQKGLINVNEKTSSSSSSVGLAIGLTVGVVAVAGLAGTVIYGKRNPHSQVGQMVDKLPSFSFGSSAAASSTARREPLLNN